KISSTLSPVAHKAPRPTIDEVSKQDAVARFHFGSDRICRMPGVIGYCKRVAAVWRERHLRFLRFSAVGKDFVEDSADVWRRIVGRQVELHRDSLPEAVGVFEDSITWNVPSQDWHR